MKWQEVIKRPLVFFDLESTGTDPEHDKIVEICLLRVTPQGDETCWTEMINPGIPIPRETTAVHKITDQDVAGKPFFREVAPKVDMMLENADLAGFHAMRFDIPLLLREMKEAGYFISMTDRLVVDALKIFHRKERRDLSAAYRFYCRKELSGAHNAEADTKATRDIFLAQLERYPDLPRHIEGLHQFCHEPDERFVDQQGRFIWRHGQAYFNFGKHRGRSLVDVARHDKEYLLWVSEGDKFSHEVSEICLKALQGEFPVKIVSGGSYA